MTDDHWNAYKKVFNLAEKDAFPGERDVVDLFEKIYETDKSDRFPILANESALLIVDMQNDFVAPNAPLWCPEARRQLPKIKRLISVCRTIRVPVIFTQNNHADGISNKFFGIWPDLRNSKILRKGSKGTEIVQEIRPLPRERIIDSKHSYDAFAGTDLDHILRDLRRRTVIIAGTNTNFCSESTARSAFSLHYDVVFGSDINSTFDALGQLATLRIMRAAFGRVMTCNDIIEELKESVSGKRSSSFRPSK
jgi:nicotinamidase-related amidase